MSINNFIYKIKLCIISLCNINNYEYIPKAQRMEQKT